MIFRLLYVLGLCRCFSFTVPSVHVACTVHCGLLSPCFDAVQALYHDNYGRVVFQRTRHPGFTIHRGVRQGCPLSGSFVCYLPRRVLRSLVRSSARLVSVCLRRRHCASCSYVNASYVAFFFFAPSALYGDFFSNRQSACVSRFFLCQLHTFPIPRRLAQELGQLVLCPSVLG